jgi:hypothetical protein
MNWLNRLAGYKRPWVGRVGLVLVVVLWLFVTAVGFAAGVVTGLALLIVGGAWIAGETWIERSGGRYATFRLVWHLCWRIGMGVAVIVVGAVSSNVWAAVVTAVYGTWLILSGLVVARFLWLETHTPPSGRNE